MYFYSKKTMYLWPETGTERLNRLSGCKTHGVELENSAWGGGAAVRRRTRDRKVAGSTPGRGAIKSTRSTQLSIPPG